MSLMRSTIYSMPLSSIYLQHGRHQKHVCDAVSFDRLQYLLRRKGRHDRVRGATRYHRTDESGIGQVEHGRHVQRHDILLPAPLGNGCQRRDIQIGVGQHDALGYARRSAHIENGGQVVPVSVSILYRSVRAVQPPWGRIACPRAGWSNPSRPAKRPPLPGSSGYSPD